MAQNISPRRGATIAGFAALVLLVLVAAFDNQWLGHWRAGRSAASGDAAHSWFASPVAGLSALAWRATKETGEPSRIFFGMLAEPLIAVVLTFLLLMLVCRGVGAERGRWSLFLGSWFVTGLAAAVALIAGTAIAGTGVAAGIVDSSGNTQFGRGDIYYTLITLGLAFGLFAGWLVGFATVLVYGSTESSEDVGTTREYSSPAIDYSDYSGASSSAASSGLSSASSASSGLSSASSSSSDDYSFAPTSPYSASSSHYESASAPTEITTPSQESDPYGGARPY
jgi:hypothetical protein